MKIVLRKLSMMLPDKLYLTLKYRIKHGIKYNLNEPKSFNEKIQWLKINDRKELYTKLVDKYEVRKVVQGKIGSNVLIPLLGVWDSIHQIDYDALPNQFVLKCTHDSGSSIICRNKAAFQVHAARHRLEKALNENYYWSGREWPYKAVKPRIIAEKYMEESARPNAKDADGNEVASLHDYKIFCFGGLPQFLYLSVGLENHKTARISFYDLQGRRLPFGRKDYRPIEYDQIPLPDNWPEMLDVCAKLAGSIDAPFIRIDLYSIGGRTYFSEFTFSPCGGNMPFYPEEYDGILGNLIDIRSIKKGEGSGQFNKQ